MVKGLSTAFALAVPRAETEPITPHLAFFQRVAAMIRKRLADERRAGQPARGSGDIDAAVRQVIGGAVDADEVIDLFAAAGLDDARLDILSDEFLARVAALEQKNLALETLRKLLTDQIRITERRTWCRARSSAKRSKTRMLRYTNKAITTAEMIARLIDLAKWVREANQQGEELGLSTEEIAFYDALAENGSAREVMQSDTLRLMARELTEMVKTDAQARLDAARIGPGRPCGATSGGYWPSTAIRPTSRRTRRSSCCGRRSCRPRMPRVTRVHDRICGNPWGSCR